jgi:hypothetical protein
MIADSTQWFAVASLVVLVACGGGGSTDAVNNTNNPTGTINPGAVGSIENPAPLALTAENSEQILLTAGAFGFSFNSAPPATQSSAVTAVSSSLASFSKAGVSQSAPTQVYNCGVSGSYVLRGTGPFGVEGIQAGDFYDIDYDNCKNRAFISAANTTPSFNTSNGGFRYTWVTVSRRSGQLAEITLDENKIEYRNYTSVAEPENTENTSFSVNGILNTKLFTNRNAFEKKSIDTNSLQYDFSTNTAGSSFMARVKNYSVIETVNDVNGLYEEIVVNYDLSYKSKLSSQPASISPNTFYALEVQTLVPFKTLGLGGWGVTCPVAGSMEITGGNGSKIRVSVVEVDTKKTPTFSRWLLETDADGNGKYESSKTYACNELLYAE